MLEYSAEHGCMVDRGKIGHKGGAVVDVEEEKTWMRRRVVWRRDADERELARARRWGEPSDAAYGRLMALREARREEVEAALHHCISVTEHWAETRDTQMARLILWADLTWWSPWAQTFQAEAERREERQRKREARQEPTVRGYQMDTYSLSVGGQGIQFSTGAGSTNQTLTIAERLLPRRQP
jgi:hypothetical protein